MSIFKIDKKNLEIVNLNKYRYESEGNHEISPQELIARFPSLVLSIPELEVEETEDLLVVREFSTSRGAIDVLIITKNLDIVLIETKLLRNSESHRTVVAQAIDYSRALSLIEPERLEAAFTKSKYTNSVTVDELFNNPSFMSKLDLNLKTGNFKVVIAGDKIHPNVLNMVEAIQSAPHLAFTIFLAEVEPFALDDDNILIKPTIVAKTNEVERSVIKLEIDYKERQHTIESESPEKEGKGNKPILSQDEYLDSVSRSDFIPEFLNFWKKWKSIGGDVRFGTTGISLGLTVERSRLGLFFFYADNFYLLKASRVERYGISEQTYGLYKESLKRNYPKAYDLLVSQKAMIKYEDMTIENLNSVFEAMFEMGEELIKESDKN